MNRWRSKAWRAGAVVTILMMVACNGTSPTTTSAKKSPKPTATPTAEATSTGTGVDSATPTPKATGTATPTPKPTGSGTAKPTTSPTATTSVKPSTDATATGTASPGISPTPSSTPFQQASTVPVATLKPTASLVVTTILPDDFPSQLDGTGGASGSAECNKPQGVVIDGSGNLYVADTGNNCIRKIDMSGTTPAVTTYAGGVNNTGGSGNSDAAKAIDATFKSPSSLALAANGDLYVADTGNNVIRKIAAGGKAVTTVAGTGTPGDGDGLGSKATFSEPNGLAIYGSSLYVADTANHLIRKVDLSSASYTVSTVAGTPLTQGLVNDPDATKAKFYRPFALGVDASGKLYVLDGGNYRVRVVDLKSAKLAVTTLAGPADDATAPFNGFMDGTGSAARFDFGVSGGSGGLAVTPDGFVYVADSANQRVRRITAAGVVDSVAGNGIVVNASVHSGSPSDGAAAQAGFDRPIGIAIAPDGTLYTAGIGDGVRAIK